MSEKKIISVRFGGKASERMSDEEWQRFRVFANFFDISEGALVEAALRYAARPQSKLNNTYHFDAEGFEKTTGHIENIAGLSDSLRCGKLLKMVVIKANVVDVILPQDSIVRYIPPYIISIEPTYQVRVNIDLSLSFTVDANDKQWLFRTLE